jgi:threonine synthase
VCRRCGGLLEIVDTPPFDPAAIEHANTSLWRYRAFLPLPEKSEPVSMGEGMTPLVETQLGNLAFAVKLDFLMPTGSFKDRGTTVLVSALKGFGYERVVEDSSGNAAASLSAYAARAGMQAEIFVPAHASPAKLAQIEVYGARLHRVEGPRENAALAVQDAARQGEAYYASHYYNPFSLAGMKTTAWEIWEQLGQRAPATVIAPVGHGTNLLGLIRGFQELCAVGLIQRMPHMIAAQADKIAPLAHAFRQGLEATTSADSLLNEPSQDALVEQAWERGLEAAAQAAPARTIAEGIAITRPVHAHEILRAIRSSGGAVVAVSEEEIGRARNEMARAGLYVEPTSATAVAALLKLQAQSGTIQDAVVTLTGSGLKST